MCASVMNGTACLRVVDTNRAEGENRYPRDNAGSGPEREAMWTDGALRLGRYRNECVDVGVRGDHTSGCSHQHAISTTHQARRSPQRNHPIENSTTS